MTRFIAPTLAAIAVAIGACNAKADDWQRAFFGHSSSYRNESSHEYVREQRRYNPPSYGPRVRSWVQRHDYDEERDSPRQCHEAVTVVGETAHSDERARNNAIAAFAQLVRWKWGERSLEIKNARNVSFTCSQASIPMSGGAARAVDAVAERVLNKTTDEIRCQLTANPCRAHAGDKGQ